MTQDMNPPLSAYKKAGGKILLISSFAEFWDMLSFFGIVSILVLYTTQAFSLSDEASYIIYGLYLAFYCAMPLAAGFVIDELLGSFRSSIIGLMLTIAGNLILCLQYKVTLFLGLSAMIAGTALYKTSCTNYVGQAFDNNSERKDKAYTIFYVILNCGAMLGPLIYGLISNYSSWSYCFLLSAFAAFTSLILFMKNKNLLQGLDTSKGSQKSLQVRSLIGPISLSILLLFAGFELYMHSGKTMFILVASIATIFFKKCAELSQNDKQKILGILFLLLYCTIFFSSSLQVGSSLTLFIDRNVNISFFHFKVPTSFFAALDPLFLVLTAPLFTWFWHQLALKKIVISPVAKLQIGLTLGLLSFLCFWISSKAYTNVSISVLALILGYLFIGAGEICLSPAILSCISDNSPTNLKNTMAGTWYFCLALAGYLGSYFDQVVISAANEGEQSISTYSNTFLIITCSLAVSILLLYLSSRYILGCLHKQEKA